MTRIIIIEVLEAIIDYVCYENTSFVKPHVRVVFDDTARTIILLLLIIILNCSPRDIYKSR